jgi:hypothetical protein
MEPPPQAVDAVDDAFHLGVDRARELVLREPAVDVVLLLGHERILPEISLDVKILNV